MKEQCTSKRHRESNSTKQNPNTELEKLYAAAIVMIGAIFFASLLGSIVVLVVASWGTQWMIKRRELNRAWK